MATNNSNATPFPRISDDAEGTLKDSLRAMYVIVATLGVTLPPVEDMLKSPDGQSRILNRAGKALLAKHEERIETRRAKVKGRIDGVIQPWRAKKESAVKSWMGLDADTRAEIPLPSTYSIALTEFEAELGAKGNDLVNLLKDYGLTVAQKDKTSPFYVKLPHPQPPTATTSDA